MFLWLGARPGMTPGWHDAQRTTSQMTGSPEFSPISCLDNKHSWNWRADLGDAGREFPSR